MQNIINEIVGASDKINQLKTFKIDGSNLRMYREEIRKDSRLLSELYKDRSAKTKRKEIMEILHAILDVKEEHSIKQHLVSQIVPVFNTILTKNMSTMYEGNVDLSFDSNMKETLTVKDYTMFPEEFSTGERNKINFIINLSIFDLTRINLNGSNIIFFDEIFTSLDKPTIKKMIALILAKFGTDTLIHVISHDDYVKSNVKPVQTLKIVKKDDQSKIIIES
jgi:DNA repair exonuclease SbcCD ATPase subunit